MILAAEVADEDAVRLGIFDESEKTGFAGFLNSWGGEIDGDIGLLTDDIDGGGEAAEIFKVEVKDVRRLSEKGLGLGGVTAKNG